MREWALVAASLAIALLLAEAACRLFLPRPGFFPRHASWLPGAVRAHPTRRYALVPGFSARVRADETFGTMHIDINADGLRERPLEGLRAAELRILAVGDSYTFGYGLESGEAWPGVLEQELRRRLATSSVAVINAGIPGYNLAQMDDMARELLPKVDPQLLVAAVYGGGFDRMLDPLTNLGDLVMRSSELRVVRLVEGGLVRSSMYDPRLVALDLWLKAHWYSGAWLLDGAFAVLDRARSGLRPATAAVMAPTGADTPTPGLTEGLAALASLQRRARAAGIPLVVLIVASFGPDHRVNAGERKAGEALGRFCASAGIPVVDPTAALQAADIPLRVRPADYHWSAAADALAARELADFVVRERLVAGGGNARPQAGAAAAASAPTGSRGP